MKAIETILSRGLGFRGILMKAVDDDMNRVAIDYDYELSDGENHAAAVKALLQKVPWTGTAFGAYIGDYNRKRMVWVFANSDYQVRQMAYEPCVMIVPPEE